MPRRRRRRACTTWAAISRLETWRSRPLRPVMQKRQATAQPTCDDTHSPALLGSPLLGGIGPGQRTIAADVVRTRIDRDFEDADRLGVFHAHERRIDDPLEFRDESLLDALLEERHVVGPLLEHRPEDVLEEGFGQRRKTIRNSFSNFITDAQLTELGIDGNLRPENLSLEQFVMIANWLADQQQA